MFHRASPLRSPAGSTNPSRPLPLSSRRGTQGTITVWISLLVVGISVVACGGTGAVNDGGGERSGGGPGLDGQAGSGGAGAESGSGGAASGGGPGGGGAGGQGTGGMGSGGQAAGGSAGGDEVPGMACPGFIDPFQSCRDQNECTWMCARDPRSWAGTCGACFAPNIQCQADEECGEGLICQPTPQPCECMGTSMSCVSGCTADSCPADMTCGAGLRCVPTSCEEGFTCPNPLDVCSPEAQDADEHGCAPTTCQGNDDCEEGDVCDPSREGADEHGCTTAHCAMDGTTCDPGHHCDAAQSGSGCVIDHCQADADCPVNRVCDPNAAETGCVRRSCMQDAECDCGYCIQGYCEERLWECEQPPPA